MRRLFKRYKIIDQATLLNWLEHQEDLPASVTKAVANGRIENLGFFKRIPSSLNPGWIVKIKTRPERLIVVTCPRDERFYWWWIKTINGCK